MHFPILALMLVAFLSYSTGDVEVPPVYLDDSPVTTKLGNSLVLNCTMPGFGVHEQPMFARWQRRHAENNAGYVTISNDNTVTPGYPRISAQIFPGGYTYWYRLTIKDFQLDDTGTYKCVTLGPTHDVEIASGTVQVRV